jgi:hypothetical protein
MVIAGDLRSALDGVVWPVCYLNLETMGTVLPLFAALSPFEQMPFLYSVRTLDAPGGAPAHRGFLATHERDGSRELAERLLQDLGSEGSIVVYSVHQNRVIRWLERRHPDLSEALARLRTRTVSLRSTIRQSLFHPEFHGSSAMKTVVAALVPGFTYIDLEIEDTRTASASFAYLARGRYYSATRAPLIRRDLYAYGARNTLALVRIHEALRRILQTA